jgi:Spy/CpxP family protein refolding chaperone
MSSAFYRLLLALVVLGAAAPYAYGHDRSQQNRPTQTAAPASASTSARTPNDAPVWWWKDEQFKKDIGLKDDQAAQIEKIWQETGPGLWQKNTELMDLQRDLSAQIAKDLPVSKISNQIKLVEMARADLATSRQIMLYKMRGILRPSQRTKFDEVHPRWQAEFDRRRAESQKRRMAEEKQKPRSDGKPDQKSEPRKPF